MAHRGPRWISVGLIKEWQACLLAWTSDWAPAAGGLVGTGSQLGRKSLEIIMTLPVCHLHRVFD